MIAFWLYTASLFLVGMGVFIAILMFTVLIKGNEMLNPIPLIIVAAVLIGGGVGAYSLAGQSGELTGIFEEANSTTWTIQGVREYQVESGGLLFQSTTPKSELTLDSHGNGLQTATIDCSGYHSPGDIVQVDVFKARRTFRLTDLPEGCYMYLSEELV